MPIDTLAAAYPEYATGTPDLKSIELIGSVGGIHVGPKIDACVHHVVLTCPK